MTQIKLGDQVVDLSGSLPTINSKAPDFLLANNELVNMTLTYFISIYFSFIHIIFFIYI